MSKDKTDMAPGHETSAQGYGDEAKMRGKRMAHRKSKHRHKRQGRRKGGR